MQTVTEKIEKINQDHFIGLMPEEAKQAILALIKEWGEECLPEKEHEEMEDMNCYAAGWQSGWNDCIREMQNSLKEK